MTLPEFNALVPEAAAAALETCCGSGRWVAEMCSRRPFALVAKVYAQAAEIWYENCGAEDWRGGFSPHSPLRDLQSLEEKFSRTKDWAGGEQAGVHSASQQTLAALAAGNEAYAEKFGYIFIVCATGKPAEEMLRLLEMRLENEPETELRIAMGEQSKITAIRLNKLLDQPSFPMNKSQITTHVLDTSRGRPGRGIHIDLQAHAGNGWQTLAQGITDTDGRVAELLPPGRLLPPGAYKLVFHTGPYFEENAIKGFYPLVEIVFSVFDDSHYHVPLLINPFGYSTYRGS